MGGRWKSAWAPNPLRGWIAATVEILSIMTLRTLGDLRALIGGVALVRNAFSITVKYRV